MSPCFFCLKAFEEGDKYITIHSDIHDKRLYFHKDNCWPIYVNARPEEVALDAQPALNNRRMPS